MRRYETQVDDLEIEPHAIFDTKTKTLYECCSIDVDELYELLNKQDTEILELQEQSIRDEQNFCIELAKWENKWQKLKEWLSEEMQEDRKRQKTGDLRFKYYAQTELTVLNKMKELESE